MCNNNNDNYVNVKLIIKGQRNIFCESVYFPKSIMQASKHFISFYELLCTYCVGICTVKNEDKLVCQSLLQQRLLFFTDFHDEFRWKSARSKGLLHSFLA